MHHQINQLTIKIMYTIKKLNQWDRFVDIEVYRYFELEQKDEMNNNLMIQSFIRQYYNGNWDNETEVEIFELRVLNSQFKEILTSQEERDELENQLKIYLQNYE